MMSVYMASDHAGIVLKSEILSDLLSSDFSSAANEVQDLGPFSMEPVDYPDFADVVCRKIHGLRGLSPLDSSSLPSPKQIGILICGSGQGMVMRANKYPHIRAALCWSTETARLAREHNDANVLCLGARVTESSLALEIVRKFLQTSFVGGHHQQRLVKLSSPV